MRVIIVLSLKSFILDKTKTKVIFKKRTFSLKKSNIYS